MRQIFSSAKGHIIRADIGIGGFRDSQFGLMIDVELSEDNESCFRFFDGCWITSHPGGLGELELKEYAGIIERLQSMLDSSGADSLMDLVGLEVDVRIRGTKAVAFGFSVPLA